MNAPLTSRLCKKCRAWFDTAMAPYESGVRTSQSLDRHCGEATMPVPTYDMDWPERRDAMRAYLAINL